LGIARRRTGSGWKVRAFQIIPQVREEPFQSTHSFDVVGGLAVHSGRARAPVVPHPIPRHQQERRISDEVVQIIEPAMRIITGPSVQLSLDLQYPTLRSIHRQRQFIGIHQRPPGIPARPLPTC
jgi:hypothetical protein